MSILWFNACAVYNQDTAVGSIPRDAVTLATALTIRRQLPQEPSRQRRKERVARQGAASRIEYRFQPPFLFLDYALGPDQLRAGRFYSRGSLRPAPTGQHIALRFVPVRTLPGETVWRFFSWPFLVRYVLTIIVARFLYYRSSIRLRCPEYRDWLFRYMISASIHAHFRPILHESASHSRSYEHPPSIVGKQERVR